MWLHRSSSPKINPVEFLATHHDYLEETLGAEAAVVFGEIVAGDLLPSPALKKFRDLMLTHMIITDALKAEAAMTIVEQNDPKKKKLWVASVYCEGRNGTVDLVFEKEFNMNGDANNWIDRRLHETPGSHGEITFTPRNLIIPISRTDATKRLHPSAKRPFMRITPSDGNMKRMRVKGK